MLSEKEKSWLEGRKVLCPRCDCYRDHIEGTGTCSRGEKAGWIQAECRFFQRKDLIPDYKDAAKFEGIVAMMLANPTAFKFYEDLSDKKEKSPFCVYCKIMGFAKLNKKKECVRTERECRRLNAMRGAESCLLSGTLPVTSDPLDVFDEEEMPI